MKKVARKKRAESDNNYESQAIICKAFANSTRIHLLHLLGRGELRLSDLQEELGISKANLSQHLSVLRSAGVVNTRREGKRVLCALSSREIKEACNRIRDIYKARAQRLS